MQLKAIDSGLAGATVKAARPQALPRRNYLKQRWMINIGQVEKKFDSRLRRGANS